MYNSFSLIKKIYYERTSGSPNELKAAKSIAQECKKFGVTAKLESFPVDAYKIKKAQLRFYDPNRHRLYKESGLQVSF